MFPFSNIASYGDFQSFILHFKLVSPNSIYISVFISFSYVNLSVRSSSLFLFTILSFFFLFFLVRTFILFFFLLLFPVAYFTIFLNISFTSHLTRWLHLSFLYHSLPSFHLFSFLSCFFSSLPILFLNFHSFSSCYFFFLSVLSFNVALIFISSSPYFTVKQISFFPILLFSLIFPHLFFFSSLLSHRRSYFLSSFFLSSIPSIFHSISVHLSQSSLRYSFLPFSSKN